MNRPLPPMMRATARQLQRTASSLLLLACWLPVWWTSAAAEAPAKPPATTFRISGVVVSSRDGSPVARAHMSAVESDLGDTWRGGGPPRQQGGSNRDALNAGILLDGPVSGRSFAQSRFGAQFPAPEPDSAVTDSTGRFSLVVAHAGMWRLTGAARGFRTGAYDAHEGFSSGIVLTSAAPEIFLTFPLTPEAVLSGIVFDEAGEPVRSAQVRAELARPPGANERLRGRFGAGIATTDDRGHYELAGLAGGEYKLNVEAQPWYAGGAGFGTRQSAGNAPPLDPSLDMVYPQTWFPAATGEAAAETIVLAGGEERQADFHLTALPAVHLKIPAPQGARDDEGSPRNLSAPTVMRTGPAAGFPGTGGSTSFDGSGWDVGGLAPGTYQVRLPDPAGGTGRLAQVTITAGSPAVVGLASAQNAIDVAVSVDGIDDSARTAVTLVSVDTGQRFSSGGGGRFRRRFAEGDDNPSAPDVRTVSAPPGRYEVYLAGGPDLYISSISATDAQVAGRTVRFTGGAPRLIVHAAQGLSEVRGVARKAGVPDAGAMILLVPANFGSPESVSPIERDQTNTDGSFGIRNVIPGEYILVAIDHGWGVNWQDAATLMQYLPKGVPVDLRNAARARKEIEVTEP